MTPLFSPPIVALGELFNEPVNRTLGCFRDFSSSYSLEPFKLVTFKHPVIISRFQLRDIPDPMISENYFLSILLVKTTIGVDEVNEFVFNLASAGNLSHSARIIYENIIRGYAWGGSDSGRSWAFRQARFGMEILLAMAREAGIDVSPVYHFNKNIVSDVLGIEQGKWKLFSLMVLQSAIRKTPNALLSSTYGLN